MSNATEPTKPKYFNCYLDSETIVNHLSDEQAGKLWKMLFAYSNRNEKQDISDRIVSMAFDVMAQQIDRDFEKYRKKCETNRANRAKATQRKQPTTIENERQRPSTTVNVGDQYKEKDKDKDKEKEEGKDNALQADSSPTSFYTSVVNDFNRICKSLPRVDKLTEAECSLIEQAESILNISFAELFRKVESSDYLCNRTSKKWNCTFKWILEPEHLQSILNGVYDNDGDTTKPKNEQSTEEFIKAYNRYEDVFNDDKSSDTVNPLFAELFDEWRKGEV